MISSRDWIVITVVAVAVGLGVVLGWEYFTLTLGLRPRIIGYIAAAVGFVVVVAILLPPSLREGSRRPGRSSKRDR